MSVFSIRKIPALGAVTAVVAYDTSLLLGVNVAMKEDKVKAKALFWRMTKDVRVKFTNYWEKPQGFKQNSTGYLPKGTVIKRTGTKEMPLNTQKYMYIPWVYTKATHDGQALNLSNKKWQVELSMLEGANPCENACEPVDESCTCYSLQENALGYLENRRVEQLPICPTCQEQRQQPKDRKQVGAGAKATKKVIRTITNTKSSKPNIVAEMMELKANIGKSKSSNDKLEEKIRALLKNSNDYKNGELSLNSKNVQFGMTEKLTLEDRFMNMSTKKLEMNLEKLENMQKRLEQKDSKFSRKLNNIEIGTDISVAEKAHETAVQVTSNLEDQLNKMKKNLSHKNYEKCSKLLEQAIEVQKESERLSKLAKILLTGTTDFRKKQLIFFSTKNKNLIRNCETAIHLLKEALPRVKLNEKEKLFLELETSEGDEVLLRQIMEQESEN